MRATGRRAGWCDPRCEQRPYRSHSREHCLASPSPSAQQGGCVPALWCERANGFAVHTSVLNIGLGTCHWNYQPTLPNQSVTCFARYHRGGGQGEALLKAAHVQELLSRVDEQMIFFPSPKSPAICTGFGRSWYYYCPEQGGSLCRGKVSRRTHVFPLELLSSEA